MIEITPAILTNKIEEFILQLRKYKNFDKVDIDICEKDFVNSETLTLEEVLSSLNFDEGVSYGFHLMVTSPEKSLKLLMKKALGKNIRVFLHQEADISFLDSFAWPREWKKAVVIKLESKLKNLYFYNKFQEVSFMSVEAGAQGNSFNEDVGMKIEDLVDLGYTGEISLDGSVNLQTARFISEFNVQRVSVGSYLKNAEDVELATMKLNLALNMKVVEE